MIFKADWLIFSIIALFLWGIWGFFSKVATHYMSPASVFLYGSIGALVVSIYSMVFLGFKFEVHPTGVILGTLTGVLGAGGVVFFFFAMKNRCCHNDSPLPIYNPTPLLSHLKGADYFKTDPRNFICHYSNGAILLVTGL